MQEVIDLKSEIKILQDSITDIDTDINVDTVIEQLLDIVSQIEQLKDRGSKIP